MTPLSSAAIIDLWERGSRLHPIDRGLALLAAAHPAVEWSELARLPIGERDAALLDIRRVTFGDRIDGYDRCASCNAEVEFIISASELLAARSASVPGAIRLENGQNVTVRLPDSFDMAALLEAEEVDAARRLLAERCVAADGDDTPNGNGIELSDADLKMVSDAMEKSDSLANVEVDLECPECGTAWSVPFDVLSYLWNELAREARLLLHDVHLLARAYGWSEREILALSPARRNAYIEMTL